MSIKKVSTVCTILALSIEKPTILDFTFIAVVPDNNSKWDVYCYVKGDTYPQEVQVQVEEPIVVSLLA